MSPRLRAAVAAACAVALGLGACGGEEEPPADGLPDDIPSGGPRLPPKGKWFGFSDNVWAYTDRFPELDQGITPERAVQDMLAAGANSARMFVGWWDIEPEPGRLNEPVLAIYDRFVRALEQRGGRVLLQLGSPPPWSSTVPGDEGAAPKSNAAGMRAFARFAAFAARRWPRAVAIETWNEPNGRFAWKPEPDPEAYARLHRAAARAIRRVNPRMKVILAGLTAVAEDTPDFMRSSSYLERLYAAGLRPADYDGLAVHPYPGPDGAEGEVLRAGFDDFQRGHAERDPDARLWVTETGVSTTGDSESGPGGRSPNDQARTIVALTRLFLSRPRIEAVYVHTLYDLTTVDESAPERGFGLLESREADQGRPKPAFCALRRLVRDPPDFVGCRS